MKPSVAWISAYSAGYVAIVAAFVVVFAVPVTLWSVGFQSVLFLSLLIWTVVLVSLYAFKTRNEYSPSILGGSELVVVSILGGSVCLSVVASLFSAYPFGGAQRLANVFGPAQTITDQKLPSLDIKNAPLVTKDLAYRKAQAALADIGVKASQLKIGEMVKQEVAGRLVWVGFLEPNGFFRWASLDGSPGYVVVSASDYSDAKVVTEVGGKALSLRYTEGAYFSEHVSRHVWLSRPKSEIFRGLSPEIDDEGNPYYVASIVEPTVGVFGQVTKAVLVVDPQTGEMKRYGLADAPQWIDVLEKQSIVQNQIDDAGEYVGGRFNFSSEGKFELSSIDQVFSEDGTSYWVAAITNKAAKTGVQRFVFVNARTKESFSYDVRGVSEDRAQQIVLDSHTKAYEASNPIPFLINGRPTYVMSLFLGDAIYAYGMVDIESETVFASKETLTNTFQAYLSARSNSGIIGDENSQDVVYSGLLRRIGQNAKTGQYKFLLDGHDYVFVAESEISHLLSLSSPTDKIFVSGQIFDAQTVNVVKFTNETLGASK